MLWISILLFAISANAQELPHFLTKHPSDMLRFISMDGRYAYLKKKPGVLGFASNFRSMDFLNEGQQNEFIVTGSRHKNRLAIESIPNPHTVMNLLKKHRIFVVDYGNSVPRLVGEGRNARLHLGDEWITYFDPMDKIIHIQNLVTQKRYEIKLSKKSNPFFVPDIEMLGADMIYYNDINESGYSALVAYKLSTKQNKIVYKSSQSATKLELCSGPDYLAVGEFPYDGVNRGSSIQYIKFQDTVGSAGLTSLYSSIEQDTGNIICRPDSLYFIKTFNWDKELNYKVSDVVKLDIKTKKIQAKSNLKHVTQLIEMDGRVLIPMRGEFFVLEGTSNLGEDILKAVPTREELQIDL